jgi:uncharacterized membrane protein
MKPLIILLVTFLLTAGLSKLITGHYKVNFSANLAMCIMLLFTAMGHFKFTEGMMLMLPDFIPAKKMMVYGTGVMEILLGLALLFPKFRYAAGIILVIFLILILPANIYAALRHVDYETATFTGKGPAYLWFRVPMQILLIMWVYYFSRRH